MCSEHQAKLIAMNRAAEALANLVLAIDNDLLPEGDFLGVCSAGFARKSVTQEITSMPTDNPTPSPLPAGTTHTPSTPNNAIPQAEIKPHNGPLPAEKEPRPEIEIASVWRKDGNSYSPIPLFQVRLLDDPELVLFETSLYKNEAIQFADRINKRIAERLSR